MVVLFASLVGCTLTPENFDDALDAWNDRVHTGRTTSRGDAPVEPKQEPEAESLESLADLLAWADQRNPAVIAAAQSWRAALERVPQVNTLPDPRLNLGYFLDEVETRTGPMDWRASLSQSLPWFGTLESAGQLALQHAHAARESFDKARLDVAQRIRDTWHELAYVDAAIDVTRGHRDLLLSWESVAQIRYSTGLANEADVIRAQVELGKLDDQLRTLEDLRLPTAARLNAELDRPLDAPLPKPELNGTLGVVVDEAALTAGIGETSPMLRARRFEIEAAKRQIDLAEKASNPSFSAGVDYTAISSARTSGVRGSGDDAVALTAGISLPLRRGKNRAAEQQALAQWAAAVAALRDAHNRLSVELQYAMYRMRDAERRVGLFKDTLIIKGRESVEITHVGYQAGEMAFLDLVDAERVLLEFQLSAARAQADHAQALAEVERLTGVPLHPEER